MTKHFDESKATSEPLKAEVPAVRSAKLPAKLEWHAFDDFARLTRSLVGRWNGADHRWVGVDDRRTYNLLVKFFATVDAFDRPEFYQQAEHRPDINNCWTGAQIKRRVVSDQVGLLIGSFPNGTPNSPAVYMKLLVEEIIVANPRVIPLEATCREIRRTKTFLPAIAEVLSILRRQVEWWSNAWEDACCLDEYISDKNGVEPIPCEGHC